MEKSDELVPEPDSRGLLNLTNRAWVVLDPAIWTMSFSIVVLDISYNHIAEIPSQIGDLVLLREFRASFNKLTSLPPEIGKLKRLRKLILNTNKLRFLPDELGKLDMLEECIVSENELEELPKSLQVMSTLRVLKLDNNKLKSIPHNIADIVTLEVISCENNNELSMLLPSWRGDTQSILFVCKLHRDYRSRMDELLATNNELSKHSQFLEHEQILIKEQITAMKDEIDIYKSFLRPAVLAKAEIAISAKAHGTSVSTHASKASQCIIM